MVCWHLVNIYRTYMYSFDTLWTDSTIWFPIAGARIHKSVKERPGMEVREKESWVSLNSLRITAIIRWTNKKSVYIQHVCCIFHLTSSKCSKSDTHCETLKLRGTSPQLINFLSCLYLFLTDHSWTSTKKQNLVADTQSINWKYESVFFSRRIESMAIFIPWLNHSLIVSRVETFFWSRRSPVVSRKTQVYPINPLLFICTEFFVPPDFVLFHLFLWVMIRDFSQIAQKKAIAKSETAKIRSKDQTISHWKIQYIWENDMQLIILWHTSI